MNLNFVLGHFTVSRGLGFDLQYHIAFNRYENLALISSVLLLSNLCVFLSLNFKKLESTTLAELKGNLYSFKLSGIAIALLLLTIFILNIYTIDLSVLGGNGDFSYIFKLIIACFLISVLAFNRKKYRFYIYMLIVFLFVVGNFDSKREIVYILVLIGFLEVVVSKARVNFNFKQIFIGGSMFLLFVYIVLIASIMRGYGNFDVSSPVDAASKVSEYLESDFIGNALTANFELNTVYGNSTNAINYVLTDEVELLYGSTFVKFAFIPLPRQLFPNKPESMINIYTSKFSPRFRAIGGSYPVNLYSEVLWNFYIYGIGLVYFIYRIINEMYIKLLMKIRRRKIDLFYLYALFMYVSLMQFVRGSGFEIWFLYGILALPLMVVFSKYFKRKSRLNNNN